MSLTPLHFDDIKDLISEFRPYPLFGYDGNASIHGTCVPYTEEELLREHGVRSAKQWYDQLAVNLKVKGSESDHDNTNEYSMKLREGELVYLVNGNIEEIIAGIRMVKMKNRYKALITAYRPPEQQII